MYLFHYVQIDKKRLIFFYFQTYILEKVSAYHSGLAFIQH